MFLSMQTYEGFTITANSLVVQRSVAPVVKGNVAGRHDSQTKSKWMSVSDEPLPKRKCKGKK